MRGTKLAFLNFHALQVELLLRKRVLVDTGNSDGRTAMHLAASEGREHVMKLLIKAEGQIHWIASLT